METGRQGMENALKQGELQDGEKKGKELRVMERG